MSYDDRVTVAELTEMLGAYKPDTPVKVMLVSPDDDALNYLLHFRPPMATIAAAEPKDGELVETWQGEADGQVVVALRVIRGEDA